MRIGRIVFRECRKSMRIPDDHEREIIWRRKMAQMDYDSMVYSERMEGERIGKKKGERIGRKKGERIGRLKMLKGLIDDGILTLTEAAKYANMSVEIFQRSVESIEKSGKKQFKPEPQVPECINCRASNGIRIF